MSPNTAGLLALVSTGLSVVVGSLSLGHLLLSDDGIQGAGTVTLLLAVFVVTAAITGSLLVWDALEREALSRRARIAVAVFVLATIANLQWIASVTGIVFVASAIALTTIVARRDFSH